MCRRFLFALLLLAASRVVCAEPVGFAGIPIEIDSTGGTTFENGIAKVRDNVAIHAGDTDIYADSAAYNASTHEVTAEGNVRVYRGISFFLGERFTYNLDNKKITAANMRTDHPPYFLAGKNLTSIPGEEDGYLIENGTLTTADSSNPDFHLRANKVRIYSKDRLILQNVTFYIGKVPVFYFPYIYQSLSDTFSITASPAFLSSWGPSLLTQITFPIRENISGKVRLDYRSKRGPAIGFEASTRYGKDNESFTKLNTYFLEDMNPSVNRTSLPRDLLPHERFRVTLQDRTYFRDDLYATIDVTKLSDAFILQDFYQSEFRTNPQPDDVVALTKSDPNFTLTALTRFQANSFFEQTERLPELVLDVKRHAIFDSPIFYEGETGFANLRRNFARGSGLQDYGALRFDSFHQFLYPRTYLGWLSVVPRVGVRGTYYSQTRDLGKTLFTPNPDPLVPDFLLPDPTLAMPIQKGGDAFRGIFNAGVEASFKVSRTWEGAQSRAIGLDGLRHIVQPFTNFSYVADSGVDPAAILQFDRFQPSTQLRPVDFPQFTSVDSIDRATIWRVGVRNRLQTRRDDITVSWLELETFIDVNFKNPFDRTPYSNLFNRLRFTPLPWATLSVESQVPAFDRGFTEVNTNLSVQPITNLQLNVGQRYLTENPFFPASNLITFGGYYRINDNWGFGVQEQYEAQTKRLEQQRYSVYRDLSSWVGSVGAIIRDNGGVKEYGVLLTFTLKAFPKFSFDLNVDPGGNGQNENTSGGVFGR